MKRKSRLADATLVIHGAAKMTANKRRQIIAWLRERANDLARNGDQYAERFTGRYMR